MRRTIATAVTVNVSLATLLAAASTSAHITITSGPVTANTSEEVVFGVGHGCEGVDTASVRIEVPAGVTSVRPMLSSEFGQLDLEKDASDAVVAVKWTKVQSAILESDLAFYKLTIRLKVPDAPFSTLFFPAHQTCVSAGGEETIVDWVATESTPDVEPAPALYVLPARFPGWNKFTVSQNIPDLSVFFANALIVWKGDAAYSANPATVDQIGQTEGVRLLAALAANDEIWVRY